MPRGDNGFDDREPDCQAWSSAGWDEGGKKAKKGSQFHWLEAKIQR